MLTVKQAAERTGVSVSLVRTWVADGTLPCYRVGAKGRRGKVLIDPADLAALIAGFRVAAQPACKLPPPRMKPQTEFKHIRA